MPGDKVTDRPQRPGQSRVGTWKKVVFALVVTGCFFLALELVLALAGITPLIKQQDPFSGFAGAMPLFVEDSREPARRTTATNKLAYFNSQSFSETKAAGTRRVFCLGGSTTYGRPYNDTTSFAGWLRELLPLADPAHRWEVINAGGISYASYRVAAVTEQLLEMDPDLLIIYTGHNEFLEDVTFPNWKDRSRLLEQATLLAAHSRIFTLLSQRLQPPAETNRQQPPLPGEVDEILNHTVGPSSYKRDDRHRDQVLSFFEFNLRRIVQLARSRNVPLLLVTPAGNLRDFSPFKSQHRDGLIEQDQQHWQKLVDQASRLAIQQQWEQAAGLLEEAVALDDRHAETHFRLATAAAGSQPGFPKYTDHTTPIHQDFVHFQGSYDNLTCWTPVGDCPSELGGLAVLGGSHKVKRVLEHHFSLGAGSLHVDPSEHEELEDKWFSTNYQVGDTLIFPALTIHMALPNVTEDRLRVSLDNRYQAIDDPIAEHMLDPHLSNFSPFGWEQVYQDWESDELKYYWKEQPVTVIPRDFSFSDRGFDEAIEMARSGNRHARHHLERFVRRVPDSPDGRRAAKLLGEIDDPA